MFERLPLLLVGWSLALLIGVLEVRADDELEPADPIAAIDGDPIYLGELNLILTERFKSRDLDAVPIDLQRATAALLVKRHLAMKTLTAQGGDLLQGMIRRQVESFTAEAKRRGSSIEQQAAARLADEKSLMADLAWRVAWGQYLKSKLTEENLRRFFESRQQIYGGTRYEVSQIFVKMDAQDRASIEAAKANLVELAEEIRSADSPELAFDQAAREHSDSPTAKEGGRVGMVEKDGDLPAAVMRVVRSTPAGQVGPPVRSPLGLHLVMVHRVEPGGLTFDQLTDHAQLRRDAADALFDGLAASQSEAKVVWFVPALRPPDQAMQLNR
jgi:parvulin-like peptidyl-prolyl isomerase